MADSLFNADALLDTKIEGEIADHYTPIPEDEYTLRVKEVRAREQKSQDQTRTFHVMDVDFVVEDDAVKAKLNTAEPTARMSIFLDLTADGHLATGTNQNVRLGQLKKACGIKDGKPWSPRHLIDLRCFGRTKQEADKNDPERIYNRVVSVTREATKRGEAAKREQGQRAA